MNEAVPLTDEALAAAAMKVLNEDARFKVGEADIRGVTYRVFENAPPSVGAIFAFGAAMHGDKEFLVFQDERFSFADMWSRACKFAYALEHELGVKQGDRVAIAMRNYPEWCVAYIALAAMGAVSVPLNAWWKGEELEYAVRDCGAKIIVVDDKRLSYISPFKEKHDLKLILARGEDPKADYSFTDLEAGAADAPPPAVNIDPEDDFSIVYTSGSTGDPKGVVLTHRSCISALFSWAYLVTVLVEARGGLSFYGDNPGILLGIPLFHVTGSHSIFMLSFMAGRKVAMAYKWNAEEAVDIIEREELTNFVGVPSQSYELMHAVGDRELPSLLDIGSGGAKRPPEHVKQLNEKFENAYASSGYGLSETNALGTVISHEQYLKRPDSAGRPVPPLTDIFIFNEDGEKLGVGEVGEIWIRSPALFKEYLNKPEQTEKSLTKDGWFKTGDLGKYDEDGYLFIVDRLKDLIIRGGENISTLEVENAVYAHGDVSEASVFSIPCEVLGERVGLAVYPKDDAAIDGQELHQYLSSHLAGFKVPEKIWISPTNLPRLATEKFDKITIRRVALTAPPSFAA